MKKEAVGSHRRHPSEDAAWTRDSSGQVESNHEQLQQKLRNSNDGRECPQVNTHHSQRQKEQYGQNRSGEMQVNKMWEHTQRSKLLGSCTCRLTVTGSRCECASSSSICQMSLLSKHQGRQQAVVEEMLEAMVDYQGDS